MSSISLTGSDITIIDDRILSDFADGDVVNIDFPNDLSAGKTGKGGNAIFAANSTGRNAVVTIRVIRGSADDKFLTARLQEYVNDPAGFVIMSGEFTKRAGDGSGNVTEDKYIFTGGVPQKIPSTKENVEGDTEQAVAIHQLFFAGGDRVMG